MSGRIHDGLNMSCVCNGDQEFIICVLQRAFLLYRQFLAGGYILELLLAAHATERYEKSDSSAGDVDLDLGIQIFLQKLPGIPGDKSKIQGLAGRFHPQIVEDRAVRGAFAKDCKRHMDIMQFEKLYELIPHPSVGDDTQHVDCIHFMIPPVVRINDPITL